MNIACAGKWLAEGLRQAGHTVINLPLAERPSLRACLKEVSVPVDLVAVELFGNRVPLEALDSREHELAAWCIDTPLNGFWLKDACALFDHVFTDQKQTAAAWKRDGLNAEWLPLCTEDGFFVKKKRKKIHDITFLGNVDEHRLKRRNLLRRLSAHFNVNVVRKATVAEAAEIFAQSRIVLNENLFSGLTLRIFQGLASGSLVATEAGGSGVDDFFADGIHLAEFTPENALEKLSHFLSSGISREEIAACGHDACKTSHTSLSRAAQFLAALKSGQARNARLCESDWAWRRLCAQYMVRLRFGGNLAGPLQEFRRLAHGGDKYAPEAALRAGDILLLGGHAGPAEQMYRMAAGTGHRPFARLALVWLHRGDMYRAAHYMNMALKRAPNAARLADPSVLGQMGDEKARIFYLLALIHVQDGRDFVPGFHKPYKDAVFDTAFEAAFQLWRHQPSSAAMRLMLDAVTPYGLGGELLPELLAGLNARALDKRQRLQAAELAYAYHDPEMARAFLAAR